MTRGLTLGKYAPLHKGHQYVFEEALATVDELVVLIYNCPETTDVPLNVRAGWIKALYPRAVEKGKLIILEGWAGPKETGDDPRIAKLQQDYIHGMLTLHGLYPITHFFSSEFYGEHMSKFLGAKDIRVDSARKKFPVSGTDVRKDAYKFRQFISPMVYADLIKKVVFLGAESTGKTTTASKMAQLYNTVCMPEYGREYWTKHNINGRLTLDQLAELAQEHLRIEDVVIQEADQYMFVDSNAMTTAMFSQHYCNAVHPHLEKMVKLAETRYHYFFLCGDDIPYVEDGTREGDTQRHVFQRQIIQDLKDRGVHYVELLGDLQTRTLKVKEVLDGGH